MRQVFGAPKKNSTTTAVTPNNKLVTAGIGTLLSVAFVAVVAIVLIGLLANPVGIGIIPAIALAGFFGVFAGVLVAGIAHNQKSLFWEKTRERISSVSPREWLKKKCTKLFGEKWGPGISETLYMAVKVTLAVVVAIAFVQLCVALGGTPLLLFAPKAALFALGCTGFVGALTTTSCCGDLIKGCRAIGTLLNEMVEKRKTKIDVGPKLEIEQKIHVDLNGMEGKNEDLEKALGGIDVSALGLGAVPGSSQNPPPASSDITEVQTTKALEITGQSNPAPKQGEYAVEGSSPSLDPEMLQGLTAPVDKTMDNMQSNVGKPEEKLEPTRVLSVKVS